jgi:serine/threonine-protein kinase
MRSRHTIEIYDYGVTDAGVFYYVMELLDGLDLESLVVTYGGQPAARVIDMMVQACASLAEAHDSGLLHRDIKPPNLYLCRAADEVDIIKVLDFGIVQNVREPSVLERMREVIDPTTTDSKLTRVGAMLGTPGFMAPEQILGMPLDGRADLYALGCCAWWLLTGGEVFERRSAEGKILHKHLHEPVPRLRPRVRGWCPPELEEVLASCLAKEPERRPANARELANRLRAIAIPPEHAWMPWHAQGWWSKYQQPVELPTQAVEQQVLIPRRTEPRPFVRPPTMATQVADPDQPTATKLATPYRKTGRGPGQPG